MSSFRVRPRFTHTVSFSLPDTRARLLALIPQHYPGLKLRAFPEFIGVHFVDSERRFWSPHLYLSLESLPDGGTRINGLYGPETEVWSLFLYGYLMTGVLGTFSGILGGAQVFIRTYPWAFWITGTMLILATLLYLGAQLGQKLGAWQTFRLHAAYEQAVGRTGAAIDPAPPPAALST
jgi:hypothetical protein